MSPDDEAQLVEAMRRALSEVSLRQEMVTKGLAHAADFTWARTARQTLDTYNQALREERIGDKG